MPIILADTNIFLRYLLNDVPSQVKAVEDLLIKARKGKLQIYIPQIVVFEIHYALLKYYTFSKLEVIGKLEKIISTNYFLIEDRGIFLLTLQTYRGKNISFVDSFLKVFSKVKNYKFISFDKKI